MSTNSQQQDSDLLTRQVDELKKSAQAELKRIRATLAQYQRDPSVLSELKKRIAQLAQNIAGKVSQMGTVAGEQNMEPPSGAPEGLFEGGPLGVPVAGAVQYEYDNAARCVGAAGDHYSTHCNPHASDGHGICGICVEQTICQPVTGGNCPTYAPFCIEYPPATGHWRCSNKLACHLASDCHLSSCEPDGTTQCVGLWQPTLEDFWIYSANWRPQFVQTSGQIEVMKQSGTNNEMGVRSLTLPAGGDVANPAWLTFNWEIGMEVVGSRGPDDPTPKQLVADPAYLANPTKENCMALCSAEGPYIAGNDGVGSTGCDAAEWKCENCYFGQATRFLYPPAYEPEVQTKPSFAVGLAATKTMMTPIGENSAWDTWAVTPCKAIQLNVPYVNHGNSWANPLPDKYHGLGPRGFPMFRICRNLNHPVGTCGDAGAFASGIFYMEPFVWRFAMVEGKGVLLEEKDWQWYIAIYEDASTNVYCYNPAGNSYWKWDGQPDSATCTQYENDFGMRLSCVLVPSDGCCERTGKELGFMCKQCHGTGEGVCTAGEAECKPRADRLVEPPESTCQKALLNSTTKCPPAL